jgi:SAM-dependent methyltransferase
MLIANRPVLDFTLTLSRSMNAMSTNTTDIQDRIALLDHADTLPAAGALRTRSYQLLELAPGQRIADVGCGAGRAVAEMTDRGATAIGIDLSEHLITVARSRWAPAQFTVASAYELPFDDGELDGYRADKVLHELDDPARALREAHRVLATGGRIVLLGQDWDTFVIDSDDPELTRTIVHARADTIPTPRAARRYRNLLLDAGFTEITVEVYTGVFTDTTMLPMLTGIAEAAHTAGAITNDQATTWIAEQTHRGHTERMFLALPLFVAAARSAAG